MSFSPKKRKKILIFLGHEGFKEWMFCLLPLLTSYNCGMIRGHTLMVNFIVILKDFLPMTY